MQKIKKKHIHTVTQADCWGIVVSSDHSNRVTTLATDVYLNLNLIDQFLKLQKSLSPEVLDGS